jgi:hypothetical protein
VIVPLFWVSVEQRAALFQPDSKPDRFDHSTASTANRGGTG